MPVELKFNNLTAGYGRQPALNGASGEFATGGLSCILGANGSGKTTLLRALCGVIQPDSGTVTFNQTNLLKLQPAERARQIAYVPQMAVDPPPITVSEAVRLGNSFACVSGTQGQQPGGELVDQAMELLGLLTINHRRSDELSGGEWRKVLIAQGLAQNSAVLLLDEPTAYLDPPAKHHLLSTLRSEAIKTNRTVVVVLHEPELALTHADCCLLLRQGKTLASGSTKAVLNSDNLRSLYNSETDWWRTC